MPKEHYRGQSTAEVVKHVAEKKLKTNIPEKTFAAWVCLSRTIRLADDLIDGETNEVSRKEIYSHAVEYLLGENKELSIGSSIFMQEMSSLKTYLGLIPVGRKEAFARSLGHLLEVTESIKQTDNAKELAKMTMLEGQIAARMFTYFLPEDLFELDNYKNYFKYFKTLFRGANVFDSIIDLSADYDQGKVKVEPTLKNRAVMLANSFKTGVSAVTHSNPGLLKFFKDGAIAVAKDKEGTSCTHDFEEKHS
jgi:hypothetical protein